MYSFFIPEKHCFPFQRLCYWSIFAGLTNYQKADEIRVEISLWWSPGKTMLKFNCSEQCIEDVLVALGKLAFFLRIKCAGLILEQKSKSAVSSKTWDIIPSVLNFSMNVRAVTFCHVCHQLGYMWWPRSVSWFSFCLGLCLSVSVSVSVCLHLLLCRPPHFPPSLLPLSPLFLISFPWTFSLLWIDSWASHMPSM